MAISFVMSLCPNGTTLREIWYLSICEKSLNKIQVSSKSDKSKGYFIQRSVYIYDSISPLFFSEWEMFQTKFVEEIKTHISCSETFSIKSCPLWDNVEKDCWAREATDDNIIRRIRFACWINHCYRHSEYRVLVAFPRQQWLQECALFTLYVYYLSFYTFLIFSSFYFPLASLFFPMYIQDWVNAPN